MLLRPGGPGGKNYLREGEGEKKTQKNQKTKNLILYIFPQLKIKLIQH